MGNPYSNSVDCSKQDENGEIENKEQCNVGFCSQTNKKGEYINADKCIEGHAHYMWVPIVVLVQV